MWCCFFKLNKLVLTFETVDEVQKCDDSNESYWAVLSIHVVFFLTIHEVFLTFSGPVLFPNIPTQPTDLHPFLFNTLSPISDKHLISPHNVSHCFIKRTVHENKGKWSLTLLYLDDDTNSLNKYHHKTDTWRTTRRTYIACWYWDSAKALVGV